MSQSLRDKFERAFAAKDAEINALKVKVERLLSRKDASGRYGPCAQCYENKERERAEVAEAKLAHLESPELRVKVAHIVAAWCAGWLDNTMLSPEQSIPDADDEKLANAVLDAIRKALEDKQ